MALLVVVWGVNFAVVKGAFAEIPPFVFNGAQFAVAAVLLAAALRRIEGGWRVRRADLPGLLALGLLGHAGYQSLFMAGLSRTSAGHSSLILAMVPLFVGAIGAALGIERPPRRTWIGLAVALLGVFTLVRGQGGLSAAGGTIAGDLLMLGSAVCWASYTILSRPYLERYSPLCLTTVTLLLGLPVILASAVPGALGLDWPSVGQGAWAALAFSSIFAVAVSYIIWYTSVAAVGGARTAAMANLIPVVALLSARVLLDEPLGPLQVGGGAVILFGVWLARSGGPGRGG